MHKQTLILLKPDAIKRQLDATILEVFLRHGFIVQYDRSITVQAKTILRHYQDVIDRLQLEYLPQAILDEFDRQPVRVFILFHPTQDAISLGRQLIGATDPLKAEPHTIRGRFGQDSLAHSIQEKRMLRNLIHASDSMEAVRRECLLWLNNELNTLTEAAN